MFTILPKCNHCPNISHYPCLALLLGALIFTPANSPAQVSEILLEDSNGIEGCELYNTSLFYWWTKDNSCLDTGEDRVREMLYRFNPTSPVESRFNACNGIVMDVNIVRDSGYYYIPNTLRRITAYNSLATNFAFRNVVTNSTLTDYELTAMTLFEGNLYYGLRNTVDNVTYRIYRISANSNNVTVGTLVHTGTAATVNRNYINKIQVARYGAANTLGIFFIAGTGLNAFGSEGDNELYVRDDGSILPARLLAGNVTHFLIRTGLFPSATRAWVTRFIGLIRPAAPAPNGTALGGYIQNIDPETATPDTRYFDVQSVPYSIVIDGNDIFFVENFAGNYRLQRKALTSTSGAGITIQSFSTNVAGLQADDDWVYYIQPRAMGTGHEIRRLDRDSNAVMLDIRARGVEAVQATQVLVESAGFPKSTLVAGKDTVVRGYADLLTNTTGESSWLVEATLDLYRNGVLIPDFHPTSRARISATTNPGAARPVFDSRNPTSFFFIVPGSRMQNGNMTFTMEVNRYDLAPETDISRANNFSSQLCGVIKSGVQNLPPPFDPQTPSLIFRPMLVQDQPTIYLRDVRNLPSFIERLLAYVPFSAVTIGEDHSVLQKNILGIDLGPWTMPDEQNWALLNLAVSTLTSNYLYGNVQVAMVPRGVPDFNGVAFPITAALVRMADDIFDADQEVYNRPQGAETLAHEWGHIAGLLHILNIGCGEVPDGPYEDYGWDGCNMGPDTNTDHYFGFDRLTRTVIGSTQAGDLMSYRSPGWISARYYSELRWQLPLLIDPGLRPPPQPLGPADKQLVVSALFDAANSEYRFTNLFAWPADMLTAPDFPINAIGSFSTQTLSLLNLTGGTIVAKDVKPFPIGEGDPNLGAIYATLPFSDETVSLQLKIGGNVTTTILRSANAPVVDCDEPLIDNNTGLLTLKWNAYDPDGDAVSAVALYSNDGGATWDSKLNQTPFQGAEFQLDQLAGGADCRFRIIFSDGMNCTVKDLSPFIIANHPPQIVLNGPEQNSTVPYGELVNLSAIALDVDQGSLPPARLLWNISGRRTINTSGSLVQLDDLEPGAYHVEVSASDDSGAQGVATLDFMVAPLTIPGVGGAALPLDGFCDPAYQGGALARVPYGDGNSYEVRMIRQGDKLFLCFEGLEFRAFAGLETVGLLIDVDNSEDTTPSGSDVSFLVDEFGGRHIYRPNGTGGFLEVFDEAPEGFDAGIIRHANSWGAEICLTDAILGGFDHIVGIELGHFANQNAIWPFGSNEFNPSTWAKVFLGDEMALPAPDPLPPVADAGVDQRLVVTSPQTVTLNGTGSYDPNNAGLTYLWTQTGGPAVTLNNAATTTPSFTAQAIAAQQNLTFQLSVDNTVAAAQDSVTITLAPIPQPYIFTVDIIVRHILGIESRPADYNRDQLVDITDVIDFINDNPGQ